MKNWSLHKKITAINTGIVVFIGLMCAAFNGYDDFGLVLGIICLLGALIDLVIGFFVFLAGSKSWGKGFLMSGGILLLLSGISCGTGLSNVNFH